MITINDTLHTNADTAMLKAICPDTDSICFFDIETTGFSRNYNIVYLIGAVYFRNGISHYLQWLAESDSDEAYILSAFNDFLKDFHTLIHFNGDAFDIPFITERAAHLNVALDLSHLESLDLYKTARKCKSILSLSDYKQKTIEHFLGKEQVVRQVEGEHEAYEYLRSYAKRIQQNKELPFMVDILNCAKGCLYGTATDPKRGTDDVMLTIAKLRNSKTSAKQEKAHFGRKSKSRSPWADTLTPEERLKNFMDAFGKLDINDFMRSYTNRAVHIEEPSEQEKNRLFAEMKKDTYEEQHRDCESCGYSSCTNMVRAIHNGVNIKENCVHYVRGMAEEEAKKIAELRDQERTEQEIRQQKITDITDRFVTLSDNIAELNTANEESANEATNLAQYIQDISRLCDELNESIRIMSDFISVYKKSNEDISAIAGQTNLLSLNASIEAARAGENGRRQHDCKGNGIAYGIGLKGQPGFGKKKSEQCNT